MATPDFILELREKVGTQPLWLSGITAVVLDETSERDPGEQPAVAAAREALEEANVVVRVEHLAGVDVTGPIVYENGDRAQYLDIIFTCRYLSGDPRPADGEALEVAWYPVDALPSMSEDFASRIRHALAPGDAAFFSIADTPQSW
jgi:ADP-ribose pyrophosphatase YjhB (NUDIX family)